MNKYIFKEMLNILLDNIAMVIACTATAIVLVAVCFSPIIVFLALIKIGIVFWGEEVTKNAIILLLQAIGVIVIIWIIYKWYMQAKYNYRRHQ
jgi:hypothetical protein